MSTLPDFMHVADSLTDAAVALESTVISHGLPYPHNIQLALRLEEIVRAGRRNPGHHRHHRRRDRRRAGSRPDRAPGDGARRPQGEPPRSADRRGAQAGRRDHRRDHFLGRAPGRHPGLRDGRDRRGASDGVTTTGRRSRRNHGDPRFHPSSFILHLPGHRHLRRSARARADAHPRRLRGGEGDPGSAGDAGMAGDARGDGGRLRHGPLPRVLQPGQRPAGGRARRHARGGRGAVPRAARAGAAVRHVGDRADPGRVRAAGRSDGSRDRPGAGRGRGAGDQGQGDDAISAGPRQRADGRSQPAGEPGAAGEQRSGGGGDCGGVGREARRQEAGRSWRQNTDAGCPHGQPASYWASAICSLLSAICHLPSAPPAAPPRSVPAAGPRRPVPACRRRSRARPRSPCHHP